MDRVQRVRRVGCAVVLALLGGAAVRAGAANPPATIGQAHHDTGSVVVLGTDGRTYHVSFDLSTDVGQPSGSAAITLTYKSCSKSGTCGFTYGYSNTLAASEVSYPDANSATVSTTMAGKPLRLSWTSTPDPTSPSVAVNGSAPDSASVADPTTDGPAQLTASFFGVSCDGSGRVTNSYGAFQPAAAAGTAQTPRIPSGLKTTKRHRPACQSAPAGG